MPASHKNPNPSATAARCVVAAQLNVAVSQREEVLEALIGHALASLEQLRTGTVVSHAHSLSFEEQARELLGIELSAPSMDGRKAA